MNYKRSLRKILFTGNIKKIKKFVKLLCQIQFAQDNYTIMCCVRSTLSFVQSCPVRRKWKMGCPIIMRNVWNPVILTVEVARLPVHFQHSRPKLSLEISVLKWYGLRRTRILSVKIATRHCVKQLKH